MKRRFETVIWNKKKDRKTKLIVVRGYQCNPAFIGRDMLIELSIMILEPIGNLKEKNKLKLRETQVIKSMKEILRSN